MQGNEKRYFDKMTRRNSYGAANNNTRNEIANSEAMVRNKLSYKNHFVHEKHERHETNQDIVLICSIHPG
jgi:hypothetical protein